MWSGSNSETGVTLPEQLSAFFKYDSNEDLFNNEGTCLCDKGKSDCQKKLPDLVVEYTHRSEYFQSY